MELLRCLLPITFLACWVTTSPVPDMQSMQEPTKSNHRHIGSRTLDNVNLDDNGVGKSISDIAAQLLDEEPEISMDEGNTNTENQAKVVDHIKGLLSDIVTNTIVDDGEDKDMYIVDMKSEDALNNTPTILQTVFNLDSNTIKDKESFIKVINAMKKREKETTQTVDTTTYISVFENNQKKNSEKDLVKSGSMEKQSILDQYIEVYDEANDDNEDTSTSLVLKLADTTTTASTTSSTTTSSTTTSSTTTSTSTTPTTTASTTTTTQEPTLIERAGNIVTGGIGGIFNGFANIGQAINQATSNFWIPIQLGRKKRGIEDIADVVKSQITSKDVFMNFLHFQKRIKAMNPEKLNEIVKGVVKEVINTDADEQIGEYESFYDDLIAGQVTDLLLRPRPYSKESFDSDLSNYL